MSKNAVKSPVDQVVTDEMVAAAEDAHMPLGDMRTALAAALAVAPAHEALEKERAERERFENLFAATCETLGRVKRELGMPDAAIGTEPEQVAALRQERDALAAHVERLAGAAKSYEESIDVGHNPSGDEIDDLRSAIEESPFVSLARRDAAMKEEALEDLLMRPDSSAVDTRQRAMDSRDYYRRLAEGNES